MLSNATVLHQALAEEQVTQLYDAGIGKFVGTGKRSRFCLQRNVYSVFVVALCRKIRRALTLDVVETDFSGMADAVAYVGR